MLDLEPPESQRCEPPEEEERKHPRLYTVKHWLNRELPPPDFLLGNVFSTTSRALLVGPTGAGKTNYLMAVNFAMAAGKDFLHWKAHRPARQLIYIDGEMSSRLAEKRLKEAVARNGGSIPDNLIYINRDDFTDMPPLNTPEGQAYVDALIERTGEVDCITFDNIQSLLTGDMKDEISWNDTKPWQISLTRRKIGQIWGHHTGHSPDKGYGTKTREWQLDNVQLMKDRREEDGLLVSFELEFTKARERDRDNRSDFTTARIWIGEDDKWYSTIEPNSRPAKQKRLKPEELKALDYLKDVMADHGKILNLPNIPPNTKVVHRDQWGGYLKLRGLHEGGDTGKHAFQRWRKGLTIANHIASADPYVWLVSK